MKKKKTSIFYKLLHPCIIHITAPREGNQVGNGFSYWILSADEPWIWLRIPAQHHHLHPSHACSTTSDLTDSQGILGLNDRARKFATLCTWDDTTRMFVIAVGISWVCTPPSPFHPNLSAVPLPVCILSRPPAHVRPDVRQSLFFFFFKHVSETESLWELPLLHSWLKQEISVLAFWHVLRSVVQKKREAFAGKKKKKTTSVCTFLGT